MSTRTMQFRLGLFVLLALVLLAGMIVFFSGMPTLFRPVDRYFIALGEAPGVSPGTAVRRSGVRIGEVEKVDLDEETGRVRLTITLEKKHQLRHNEQPTLTRSLIGDTTIDFVQRPPGAEAPDRSPVEPGEELAGVNQADVRAVVNQVSDAVPTAQETLIEIRKLAQRYDKMGPTMEKTTREFGELAQALREAVPDLRRTNTEIQETARKWGKAGEGLDTLLRNNQDKLPKTLDNLNEATKRLTQVLSDENQRNLSETLKNARAASENMQSMMKNADELYKEGRLAMRRASDTFSLAEKLMMTLQQAFRPMAERSESIMKNLDESAEKLNQALSGFDGLFRAFTQGDGTFQKLLTDPSLYNNLNQLSCIVIHLMPQMERIIRDAEVFVDKIARHPEVLGLGGIVRPSLGIKETPVTTPVWPRPPGH